MNRTYMGVVSLVDPPVYVHAITVSPPHIFLESDARNTSDNLWLGCHWLPPNHVYFQFANLSLLLSYLAPNGIYGLLFLRIVLCIASVFFSLWAWAILCAFDTFLWNCFLAVINLVQAILIIYHLRPLSFSPEIELIYDQLFKPLNVPRHLFKKAVDLHEGVFSIKEGQFFATEDVSKTGGLSLLFSGSMSVSLKGKFAHEIGEFQFLDSPEYVSFTEHDYFKVTIKALEECQYICWSKSTLKSALAKEPFLSAIFENIVGRDIAGKLFMMNRHVLNTPQSLKNLRSADLCTLEMEIMASCRDEMVNEDSMPLQFKSLPTLADLHDIRNTKSNDETGNELELLIRDPLLSVSHPTLTMKRRDKDSAV